MQSRGYRGQIAHLHERPLALTAWATLCGGLLMAVMFQFAARQWLPHS